MKMTGNSKQSQQFYAKVAGFTYLLIIVIALLSTIYVDTQLIIPENDAATAENILANEMLFRFGIAGILIMYISVVFLAWALYILLRSVNKNLALLALLFRSLEAVIGAATILLSFIIVGILNHDDIASIFEMNQLNALTGIFLNIRTAGLDIVLIFVGIGGALYCYLFYKSQYVPRILAAWGVYTYLTMIILGFISILIPDHPVILETIFYGPGGLFEIIFGIWLLIKGVKLEY